MANLGVAQRQDGALDLMVDDLPVAGDEPVTIPAWAVAALVLDTAQRNYQAGYAAGAAAGGGKARTAHSGSPDGVVQLEIRTQTAPVPMRKRFTRDAEGRIDGSVEEPMYDGAA